jgi:hypothetical protein
MSILYEFVHKFPSGQECHVEAEIEPLIPAHINCLPEDATPEEGGTAEVTEVTVLGIPIDLSDLWIKARSDKVVTIYDSLGEIAYEKWANEQ